MNSLSIEVDSNLSAVELEAKVKVAKYKKAIEERAKRRKSDSAAPSAAAEISYVAIKKWDRFYSRVSKATADHSNQEMPGFVDVISAVAGIEENRRIEEGREDGSLSRVASK